MADSFIFGKEVRLPDGRIFLAGLKQHSIWKLSIAVNELLLAIDKEQELLSNVSEVPFYKPLLMAASQPVFHEQRSEDMCPHVLILSDRKELVTLSSGIEEELRKSLENMCDIDVLEQNIIALQPDALQNELVDRNAGAVNNGIKDRIPGKDRNADNTWKADQYQSGNRRNVRPQNKT